MKHIVTTCLLSLCIATGITSAQKSVISTVSQGNMEGSCANLLMSATIGQAIAGTFSCGDYSVLVGFQQPIDVITTPYQNIQWIEGLTIYPNPAFNELNMEGTLKSNVKEITFRIFDLLGRQTKQFSHSNWNGTYQFRIDDLLPGMYLLTISTNQEGIQSVLFHKQ